MDGDNVIAHSYAAGIRKEGWFDFVDIMIRFPILCHLMEALCVMKFEPTSFSSFPFRYASERLCFGEDSNNVRPYNLLDAE